MLSNPTPTVDPDVLADALLQLSSHSPQLPAQLLDAINQSSLEDDTQNKSNLFQLLQRLISREVCTVDQAIELLDKSVLQASGLISSSQILSTRSIRINTGLLYKQQKFNLLREDNEGYAKLSHEFNLALSELPKGGSLDVQEMAFRCGELLTVVNALIGYFELDPNRVLDNVLDICSQNLLSHSKFILYFLHHSPWASPGCAVFTAFASLDASEKRHRLDRLQSDFVGFYHDQLHEHVGSKLAAQLLGFKLRTFSLSSVSDEKTLGSPEPLMFFVALLIKSGFVRFSDIYSYVRPPLICY